MQEQSAATLRDHATRREVRISGMRDAGPCTREGIFREPVDVLKGPSSVTSGRERAADDLLAARLEYRFDQDAVLRGTSRIAG